MKSKIMLSELYEELDKIFIELRKSTNEKKQAALDAGAAVLISALEQAAPQGETKELAGSFEVKYRKSGKYKGQRYIGSTKTVRGKGADGRVRENIPLANIIEYGSHGESTNQPARPFMRQTFEANKNSVFDAMIQKLK